MQAGLVGDSGDVVVHMAIHDEGVQAVEGPASDAWAASVGCMVHAV